MMTFTNWRELLEKEAKSMLANKTTPHRLKQLNLSVGKVIGSVNSEIAFAKAIGQKPNIDILNGGYPKE